VTGEPSASPAHEAPWFYRKRATLFGALYGVAFFFGFLFAGLLGVSPVPLYAASGRPAAFAALVVVLAVGGWALRVWASSYLAASVVWNQDVTLSELRVSGPYRFTRNPLYLGNLLQALGIGMLGPWPVFALLIVGMLVFQSALISVEERFLARESSDAYERYRASVAQLVPLPWKVARGGTQSGSLRDGVRSEMMTAVFAAVAIIAVLAHR
jgi:protein-S-isoprenylcysteine O-methyltransferase Ste14